MENERVRITLDKPDKTYFSGDTIKGTICLNLTKRTKIRAIKVQVTGKGKCKWMEILRKNAQNESSHSLFYTSKEIYASEEKTLPGFEPRGIELSAGEHMFSFSMLLLRRLPSTFKGTHGKIKYKLRILIQRPWTFDERYIIPFIVVKRTLFDTFNPISVERQITKTISLFGTRPITVYARLPNNCAVRGEPFPICVTVQNNSTTNVEKLRFSILQNIRYFSHEPLCIQKLECIPLMHKETGAVSKKSERTFEHELLIPDHAQPSDDHCSKVIHISYDLRVEAVLRGFFKNIILDVPFQVYARRVDDEVQSNSMNGAAGNPFEQSNNMFVFVPLDGTVASPSHSSQYSESSCSINSTTSDSSAATLSPAVGGGAGSGGCGGGDVSYGSGFTFQLNSPSARASMRSSNVPYVPYSSSPMMMNSYPPQLPAFSMPESPQYMLMSQSNSTTGSNNQLPTTSAMSFLNPRQPPGAHELPPSYEELFGNASAPPTDTFK